MEKIDYQNLIGKKVLLKESKCRAGFRIDEIKINKDGVYLRAFYSSWFRMEEIKIEDF